MINIVKFYNSIYKDHLDVINSSNVINVLEEDNVITKIKQYGNGDFYCINYSTSDNQFDIDFKFLIKNKRHFKQRVAFNVKNICYPSSQPVCEIVNRYCKTNIDPCISGNNDFVIKDMSEEDVLQCCQELIQVIMEYITTRHNSNQECG